MDQNNALLDVFRTVTAELQRLVEGVQPEQWHDPTPCTDWDAHQLVNHIAFGHVLFARIARGDANAFPPSEADRAADHLGDDPAGAYKRASQELLDAFEAPGFFDGTYQSPVGEQSGAGLVQMRVTEQLAHGWDLARATGQRPQFPDQTVEQVLTQMRQRMAGRPREGMPFKAEQQAAEGAPPIDQLAAFLGRSV